ncbi:Ohr family peroxiredoxin [Peloplasma aerotolerans]|uniref:Ohr family peroxiredoxin n=1 Tax=Peloplasma aerotolerans TaxID=3044389 RepID=A0AAW6U8L1_9MOLU|nr:Ohr family peroxiredoxin [Mariniplasma sp. M4Ah]MDI6453065.1 Ohr family peroxiredoxin [Mariniplasma sp. M4Ah]MDR4969437.1 Ohr family peroxiredoxin [Acholeplasmataceae bacterium]
MKKILERSATTFHGRDGLIKDTDSGLELKLSKPKEMGGLGENGTNPEELFAAGYSSCLASSMEYLLKNDKIDYKDLQVSAVASLVMHQEKGFLFQLVVDAQIQGVTKEVEKEYIEKAYNFCPYSKAIKGNVEVRFM